MFFQNGNKKVSDKFFIDFRWNKDRLAQSNQAANDLGRNPYDLFAGLDMQANGINSNRTPEMLLDKDGKLNTLAYIALIGLYEMVVIIILMSIGRMNN